MFQQKCNKIFVHIFEEILLSISISILITLFINDFYISSFKRLIYQITLLSLVAGAILYLLDFRKNKFNLEFSLFRSGVNGIISLIITFHLIPPQASIIRYSLAILLASFSFFIINQAVLMKLEKLKDFTWRKMITGAIILLAAANLAIILYNARFVRIYGDDFLNVLKLEQLGVWKAGMLSYKTWSGRFFSNFLAVGLSNKPWVLLVFLLLIQVIHFSVFAYFFKNDAFTKSLAFSLLITLTIYTVTPDMYKSLYWICAAMDYLPLMVMIPIYFLIAYRIGFSASSIPLFFIIFVGFLSFLITTCHESAAIGWVGLHLVGLAGSWLRRLKHRKLNSFIVVGLVSSVIGLLVMIASPGVVARSIEQGYTMETNILVLLLNMFRNFLGYLHNISQPIYIHHGFIRPGWLLLIGLFGFAWLSKSPLKRAYIPALLSLALALAMTIGAFIPGALILNDTIPFRAQFIPTIFLVFGICIFGLLLPQPSAQKLQPTVYYLLILITLIGTVLNLIQLSRTIAPMRQYARDWDARDELLRATHALPRRLLSVPWDEYEQNLRDFRRYYSSRE